jgi:hypothetical protein
MKSDDPSDVVVEEEKYDENKLTTTTTTTTTAAEDVVENITSDVVSIVREFIEVLRLEFKQNYQQNQQQIILSRIPLYTRMKERGLFERAQSIVYREHEEILLLTTNTRETKISKEGEIIEEDNNIEAANGRNNIIDDEFEWQRQKVMYDIALPIVEILARCYKILDDLPPPPSSTLPSSAVNNNNNNNNNKSKRSSRDKPIPPRGMLSIQDYTDIACLLEFIVCTGILPSLVVEEEEQIKSKKNSSSSSSSIVDDRIRTNLPKSLAGRIPKNALRWGTSLIVIHDDTNESKASSSSLPLSTSSSSLSSKALSMYGLLVRTTESVTKLVLLDRFRPMLLPRHLVDIYSACFRAEYLATTITATSNNARNMMRSIDDVYYQALGLVSHESKQECEIKVVVDTTLQAAVYQTLLSSTQGGGGIKNSSTSKSQQWLLRRV